MGKAILSKILPEEHFRAIPDHTLVIVHILTGAPIILYLDKQVYCTSSAAARIIIPLSIIGGSLQDSTVKN